MIGYQGALAVWLHPLGAKLVFSCFHQQPALLTGDKHE